MTTKTLQFLAACLLLILQTACQTPEPAPNGPQFVTDKVEKAFKEVMEIHDEVMPFISNIKKDKRKLAAIDSSEKNEVENQQIEEAIQLLIQGDSLMFDWMKNFKTPKPDMSENEALPYLAKEKEKITRVNVAMKKAIENAQNILAETNQE